MSKFKYLIIALLTCLAFQACEDETSQIGQTLDRGEVTIMVDSTFVVKGESVYTPSFDARSATKLLGRIAVPEYGDLRCTFVSQLMAASSLAVPDSISVEKVDSMRILLTVPRGALTGDSLAPQQVSLYALTKQLPADLKNSFDPDGYFSQNSLLGKSTYTLSALAMTDSAFKKVKTLQIPIRLPNEFAKKVFNDYRNNPQIFAWPSSFNKYFPGLYAESSFGSGCIANIQKVEAFLYWHHQTKTSQIIDNEAQTVIKTVKDSIAVFASAPEVLSSNNINLRLSTNIENLVNAGKAVILSPAGYNVKFEMPVKEILSKYNLASQDMTVINDLRLSIPASTIENDYNITPPPYLLMVPTKDLDTFFAENKVPDDKTSFWASYSTSTGKYNFTSMRDWLVDIAEKSGKELDEVNTEFTLVPVAITTQDKNISYSQTITVVTECTPYVYKPTMGILNFDKANLVFTYSSQVLE